MLGVASEMLEEVKPVVLQRPVPELPLAAEPIFVGVAESIAQLPPPHWKVGAEPVPPVQLAEVELRVSEDGRLAIVATNEGGNNQGDYQNSNGGTKVP